MLATQAFGYFGRHAAQYLVIDIDQVPVTFDRVRRRSVSFHWVV